MLWNYLFNKAEAIAHKQEKIKKQLQKQRKKTVKQEVAKFIKKIEVFAVLEKDQHEARIDVPHGFTMDEFAKEFVRKGFRVTEKNTERKWFVVSWF